MKRLVLVLACIGLAAPAAAQVTARAYLPLPDNDVVQVIDTRTHAVVGAPIPVGDYPTGVVVAPDGRRVYVINTLSDSVTVIDASSATAVGAPIPVGDGPFDIDITPDGRKVYVSNVSGTVSVIDTATGTVTATITIGAARGLAASPNGQRIYVTSWTAGLVAIDTTTDTIVGSPIPAGLDPLDVEVTPDGTRAYISNTFVTSLGAVFAVDLVSGLGLLPSIPVSGVPRGITATRDGSTILVATDFSSVVRVIDVATNTIRPPITVGPRPIGIAQLPGGQTAYVASFNSNAVTIVDLASMAPIGTIPVGSVQWTTGGFVGPNIITTTCSGCGPLALSGDDPQLTALGFERFVNVDDGVITLAGNWTTTRTLSLLAGGGTIDTNGFTATIDADVINSGTLVKTGAGSLLLAGASTHAGGTTVQAGDLVVDGVHSAPIRLEGGRLRGDGAIGALQATGGRIVPSIGDGILSATTATLASGATLEIAINGPTLGTHYTQLAAGNIVLGNATLLVAPGYTPTPGQAFTIVTNAAGTFAGLPEGAAFTAAGVRFRITYQGGAGHDVVLTADNPPTLTALADQALVSGGTLGPLAFTVGDDLTPASSLVVTATSSNAALLPSAGIALGGAGSARTLTATPVLGASGTTIITLTVSDGFQTTQRAFTLTVTPAPVYYLSEGASGGFFSTDLLLANPNGSPAPVVITFFTENGQTIVEHRTLPPTSRTTLRVTDVEGLDASAFSTSVLSTAGLPLIVERTMWWDAAGFGAHTEKASAAASSRWYFAEGAQGWFHTYLLLLNPNATPTTAHVTWFIEGGPAVQRDYPIAARARLTLDAGADPALVDRAFGALVEFELPGMAERAMYFGDAPPFSGGHASAGSAAPSPTWFLAEGATGPFFDTFLLIANPDAGPANVTVTYLRDQGEPIVRSHALAGHQRLTLNVAQADPALVNAAVSMRVDADRPVVAERSQYWPRGAWHEAHNSAGETAAGMRWGFAEGRVGGDAHAQTYLLVANPGTQSADLTATFLRSDGTTIVKTFTVAPTSRFNIAVTGPGSHVPELANESFGAVIEATQPVIVERSLYTDSGAVTWAAGSHATGTRLP
jgi:YVTN family beta-propeller protein/autotransporter-associated beta strand protein